jgi:hypothetical protein
MEPRRAPLPTRRKQYEGQTLHQSNAGKAHTRNPANGRTSPATLPGHLVECSPMEHLFLKQAEWELTKLTERFRERILSVLSVDALGFSE